MPLSFDNKAWISYNIPVHFRELITRKCNDRKNSGLFKTTFYFLITFWTLD